MNSEEGMSMAKMAVTVLLVVLVIGAVVAIVYAAYSWFGSGTDKLADQVTSIDKSAFSQFDDAQVSGTDVLSALKSYRESDIAIFICNKSNTCGKGYSDTPGDAKAFVYCAVPKGWTPDAVNTLTYNAEKGKYEFAGFEYDTSKLNVIKNTNFSPTTTISKSDQYVKQSAKWYANIVYDSTTDEIAGILFRQMS